MRDLYSLYELIPTAIKVKEEKKTNTNIVKFETSTSPSWKDIKIFIRHHFFNINIIEKSFIQRIINSEELGDQIQLDK